MTDSTLMLISVVKTISQILTAGIAITAFSLLLFALSFNLRDRVARVFALIMIWMAVIFTAEAIGSTSTAPADMQIWIHVQWVGIIMLPATYLHFSDAILATTGKPSRGRRKMAVLITYLLSLVFLTLSFSPIFMGPVVVGDIPAPFFERTFLTNLFLLLYLACMVVVWINFYRAYRRTLTDTSRRRMAYLILGAIAPMLGSFPFLLFGSDLATQSPLVFWSLSILSNILVGILLMVMAYSVSFFGVAWPDRVVKTRLLKWLLRGPFTASVALGLATIVRRIGEVNGVSYSAWVPIVTVASIVILEFMITILAPIAERVFYGDDSSDLELLRMLEERLVTEKDLRQFLELALAAIVDRLQAQGVCLIELNGSGPEVYLTSGKVGTPDLQGLMEVIKADDVKPDLIEYQDEWLYPLIRYSEEDNRILLGALLIYGLEKEKLEAETLRELRLLSQRIALALRDRRTQQQVFQSLQTLTSQESLIQRMRAAGSYNGNSLLRDETLPDAELVQWVRDALNHYWGGPKLTESPLMRFHVVERALLDNEGNHSNALREVLREAIERVRPAGEKRYTNEWILYNILEMKFMEGRKVKEIAMRLSVSEADLYRKQRVAIEAVAQALLEMEDQVVKQNGKP